MLACSREQGAADPIRKLTLRLLGKAFHLAFLGFGHADDDFQVARFGFLGHGDGWYAPWVDNGMGV